MRVAFLLPARAGGGGVHSVVQEAAELANLGADVSLLVPNEHLTSYRTQYALSTVRQLGIQGYSRVGDIAAAIAGGDLAVATMFTSVRLLADALRLVPETNRPRPAYYVQDYEPFFCEPGTPLWNEATESYELLPEALVFAKTKWLCDQISHHHRRPVQRVEPSIDHSVYYPRLDAAEGRTRFSLMIRPQTPRRAPRRTARMANWLVDELGSSVRVNVFGCHAHELREHGIQLAPQIEVHGFLRLEQVAELLRSSDYFLDLSDYQAFGRTGVEAMACGCVPVMPSLGGAGEFVEDAINGFLVDTSSDAEIIGTLRDAIALSPAERDAMALAAMRTASHLSVRRAALSEYAVLRGALGTPHSGEIRSS